MNSLTHCLIFLLLLNVNHAFAQNQTSVDSLQKILKTNLPDKQKTDVLNLLAREYVFSDSSQASNYVNQALTMAKKADYPAGAADALFYRAWVAMSKGQHTEALELYNHTLQVAKKANYRKGIANAYNGMGGTHRQLGNYPQAMKAYQRSLKLREKIGDKRDLADNYNDIGILCYEQGYYTQAMALIQRSLALKQQIGDKRGMGWDYHYIGNIYFDQDNYSKAMKAYQRALVIRQQIGDKYGIAHSYDNMGEVYRAQGNYPKALKFLKKGLKTFEQIKNKSSIAESKQNLGKLALAQKQPQTAKMYFEQVLGMQQVIRQKVLSEVWVNLGIAHYYLKAYPAAQTCLEKGMQTARETGNPTTVRDGAEYLAKVYRATKQNGKAYQNLELFKKMADSLLNEKNIRQITHLEDQYIAQKREDSIHLVQAKKEVKHQTGIRNRESRQRLTLAGLGLTAVLTLILLFFYRNKQRSNYKLNAANEKLGKVNKELNHFNQQLQVAHNDIKVAHEEIKNAHASLTQKNNDITASMTYAQRIQQAVLPLAEIIKFRLPEHFILFRPRDVVSGDFYWCEEDQNKIFIAAGDCTGHGVPGAFMTMLGIQALNHIVLQNKVHSPELVLLYLEGILHQILKSDDTMIRDGMDIALLVLDKQKQTLQYAGAKISLIMVQNNELKELKGSMYSINGYRPENKDIEFRLSTITLGHPVSLYLHSDGYPDQFGGHKGKKFMVTRLHQLLLEISPHPMEQQQQILENTLDEWMEEHEQVDDILVMGIKIWQGQQKGESRFND